MLNKDLELTLNLAFRFARERRHERLGIGRGVMEAIIRAAWDAGAYKIMLLTGKGANARGFYEKLGFDGDEKHGMILRRLPSRHEKD